MSVPAKRAAYSDRMAWMMALLAEIVYERFDEESDDLLMSMAEELAGLAAGKDVDAEAIKARLQDLAVSLAGVGRRNEEAKNEILKAALAAGGFSMVGETPIHIPETDTQAMVIRREATAAEPAFVVLCFRGTQQVRDWLTNLRSSPVPIANPKTGEGYIGNMHKGFHDAFTSAEQAIRERLEAEDVKNLPLYITGHSLGGALAVVATWYISARQLAACYTFGAPRVGDEGLLGWYKTPIYRIVNAADPVPFVPPSGRFVAGLKHLFRFLAALIPWGGLLDRVVGFLVRQQNFRHFGDMKYLPFAEAKEGEYPQTFRIHPGISSSERLFRYVRMFFVKPVSTSTGRASAKPDRIDRYHGMDRYREKLRAVAINRNA
jgi:hypothetical protein